MLEQSPSRPLYLSIPEAGALLYGVGPKRSYQLARRGVIPTVHTSVRRIMVPMAALEAMAEADTEKALADCRGGKNF